MNKYLKLAKEKREVLNRLTNDEMNLPMKEFIPCIYHNCSPNVYGSMFAKKIIMESNGFLTETNISEDNGDCVFLHPETNKEEFGEIKISYRGINGNFRITNIRDHQNLNYFILCFVDTEDDFRPYYYVVPKEHVTNSTFFKLSAMNGTYESNKHNMVVPKSMTVRYDDMNWYFSQKNILGGNTYSKLKSFITNKKIR
jgi:hypothetical protein